MVFVLSITYLARKWTKTEIAPIPKPESDHFSFNNVTTNPALMTDLQALFVILMIFVGFVPIILVSIFFPGSFDILVNTQMYRQCILGLIVPSFFYIFNKDIRLHYKREFWNSAPDWLQIHNPINNQIATVSV